MAGAHICHPQPAMSVILKVTRLLLGKKLRNCLYQHKGSQEGVLDSLATYGIPKTAIPEIWGGNFETKDQSTLLEGRRLFEKGRK